MSKRTLKQRQEACEDVFDACQIDPTFLSYIIDDYVYRLTDRELDDIEDEIFKVHQKALGGTD